MMYEISTDTWEGFHKLRLSGSDGASWAEIIPEKGALVTAICLNGKEVLDGPATHEELVHNDYYKGALLFPFPNRLDKGEFSFQGQQLNMQINEAATGNALHGFASRHPFSLEAQSAEADKAVVTLGFNYDGKAKGYPFPAKLWVTYMLTAEGFICVLRVLNTGKQTMPFGLGWHPYFTLGPDVNHLKLKLPPCRQVVVNERMLPTGEKPVYTVFSKPATIGNFKLDHCFEITEHSPGRNEIVLENSSTGERLVFWQEAGAQKLPYFQIFTPPFRESIAIEPMSCNINALNNGEGLQALAPGDSFEVCFGVTYQL